MFPRIQELDVDSDTRRAAAQEAPDTGPVGRYASRKTSLFLCHRTFSVRDGTCRPSSAPPSVVGGGAVQSISASELLKQQKQKQRELLENRRRRAETIQGRTLQNSAAPRPGTPSALRRDGLTSPKAASEVPKTSSSPHVPTLGRGFSEGEDILFFDHSPPPAPAPSALSLSAAKMAAVKKLRGKGAGLEKEDPNAVKRKRSNSSEIQARVEKSLSSPSGTLSSNQSSLVHDPSAFITCRPPRLPLR